MSESLPADAAMRFAEAAVLRAEAAILRFDAEQVRSGAPVWAEQTQERNKLDADLMEARAMLNEVQADYIERNPKP